MQQSISRFRSNRSSCMWQLIWAFAGEACSGTKGGSAATVRFYPAESRACETRVTLRDPRANGRLPNDPLRSVAFVIGFRPVTVGAVAARIRPFAFAITVRSVIVIIADSAASPQPVQDQTGRPSS